MVTTSIETAAGVFNTSRHGRVDSSRRIVFVHGLATSLHLWDDVIEHLDEQDGEYIAVDVLGHGRSSRPPHLYTISDHARSIVELLDKIGWAGVHLVGNSMGAQIALAMAALFPDRVCTVSAIGCPAFGSVLERDRWLAKRSVLVDLDTGAPVPREPLGASTAAQAIQQDRALGGIWILNSIWAVASYDLMHDLGGVRCPVAAIYGDEDWLRDSGRNLDALPGSTAITIEGAGHHAPIDDPRSVANVVWNFISTYEQSDASA